MQGTKLPRAKLWIAGVSTLAILMGCEAQPVKQEAATGNEYKYPAPPKEQHEKAQRAEQNQAVLQGASVDQAKPADATADQVPPIGEGGIVSATPAAEVDQFAGAQATTQSAQAPSYSGIDRTRGSEYAPQAIPGEGEKYIATNDSAVKQVANLEERVSTFSIDVDTGAYSNVR